MANGKKKFSHLDLNKRIGIKVGLDKGFTFTEIAKELNVHTTTVSREIKAYSQIERKGSRGKAFNDCALSNTCEEVSVCNKDNCYKNCRRCKLCIYYCSKYTKIECNELAKAPYVCNNCKKRNYCSLEKRFYSPDYANNKANEILVDSRIGINSNETEIDYINEILKPLVTKGQSIHHIYQYNKDSLTVSKRTLYNYVNHGSLDIKRIDMPRSVKFKKRKQNKHIYFKIDKGCRKGRTYQDFQEFLRNNNNPAVVQMDIVEGIKGGKVFLTIHFTNCNLMLAFIRDRNNSQSVIDIFEDLYQRLGRNLFRKLFTVILTDRGSEFTNPTAIEFDKNNNRRTHIFYCDPGCSFQKGECEQNHTLYRKILPKGKSLDFLDKSKMDLCVNHVNSYIRKELENKTPINVFAFIYGASILEKLGVKSIDAKDVNLTPSLVK